MTEKHAEMAALLRESADEFCDGPYACGGELGNHWGLLRSAADEVELLSAQLDDRNGWCDHLAARESALLLAVPRPFRTLVHRRATKRMQKENA